MQKAKGKNEISEPTLCYHFATTNKAFIACLLKNASLPLINIAKKPLNTLKSLFKGFLNI